MTGEVARARPSRSFALGLGLIALAALGIRIAAALWYDANTHIGGDAVWYIGVARHVVAGDGFIEPLNFALGRISPTAAHPPVYPLYLALFEWVHEGSILGLRLWSTLPGTATVVLLGFVGREIADERAGLIAVGLAAVSISLFAQDVILWSEGFYGFTIVLTVLAAYRYLRRPDLLHVGLLAAAIGLASLTRGEGGLLFLVLFVPLVLRGRDLSLGRRMMRVGVGALVIVVLLAPWLIYNNRGRFEHPVGITITLGTLIGSANCPNTYSGPAIGGWGGLCEQGLPDPLPADESEQERLFRDAGLQYASEHLDRLPIVLPIRVLRSFGFYAPVKMTADDLLLDEGGIHWAAWVAVLQYWLYLVVGIFGAVTLYRRRVALLPLVAPVITIAVISLIGYGTMRFRIAFDVVLPVLAGVAVSAWLAGRAGRSDQGDVASSEESGSVVARG